MAAFLKQCRQIYSFDKEMLFQNLATIRTAKFFGPKCHCHLFCPKFFKSDSLRFLDNLMELVTLL